MRYYSITVTDPASGQTVINTATGLPFAWTSFVDGQTDPNALNIELDLPEYTYADPGGSGWVRIWGISLQDIAQSANLAGKNITIAVGFQQGLPLANPAQAGVVAVGSIVQCIGNWIGTDMTLDMFITGGSGAGSAAGGTGTPAKPKNIVLNWPAGMHLSTALENTLKTAFPTFTVAPIDIYTGLVQMSDSPAYFNTMPELAQFIKQKSRDIRNPNGTTTYTGVDILLDNNSFIVFDGSSPGATVQIQFQELIGQPTWIAPGVMQVKCPMRSDININDSIMLPQGIMTTTQQSQASLPGSPIRDNSSFTGKALVSSIRHVGNFRQANADAWVTIINAGTSPVAAS